MLISHPLRIIEGSARVYRRTWRGSVMSSFMNPVLYLLAMGMGLGSLVDSGDTDLGMPYLTFLAPGLLAAAAMNNAAVESAWPVMAGIKWRKTYDAILSTPMRVVDLVRGHLGWLAIRLVFITLVFAGVMTAFGATTPLEGLLSIPPAVASGLAFAALITAYTAYIEDQTGLSNLFRFGIVPLFLFSGTFFPISQLPGWIQPLAYVTPLFHGVSLCRGLALGVDFMVNPWISVAYTVGAFTIGAYLATRLMTKRLVK